MQRLNISDLQIGKPLPWDVYDSAKQLLLKQGVLIQRETQIEALIERGLFVDGDAFIGKRPQSRTESRPARVFDPFWQVEKLESKLAHLLRDKPTPETAVELCAQIDTVQKIAHRDADACLSVAMSLNTNRYAIAHMLHCAMVCELVARRLGWSDAECLACSGAAITMNVSMLDLQNSLFHQAAPPSPAQREAIDQHPERSVSWLQEAGVKDEMWLRAVLEHHENHTGSGYPHRKTSDIYLLAELLRLADIYCAKVKPRSYRRALPPNRAAHAIFVEESGSDHPMAQLLIKELGIYPPGTFVKLANGETAMVLRRGEQANTPKVISLSSGTGIPYVEPIPRNTANKGLEIVAVVPSEKVIVRIDRRQLWGYEQ